MKLDFHSHILPGLDDGATDIEDAVAMVSAMKDWGFERITCTPHITNKFRNTPETIKRAFEELQEALYVRNIEVDMRMSAEYRLVPETWPEVLEKNWLMPIEDRFILMELPIFNPEDIKDIKPLEEFRKVISMGLTPLLPHPERYFYLSEKELTEFLEAGVRIQSNYGSLAGLYGEKAERNVRHLVEQGLVSYYGTDMHNLHYVKIIGQWFAKGNRIGEY
ncbi:MAG: capsular biosynthesis protein [Bacteroidales bacterium]|nr:capsular biosynthesis protein [Bacteroidales bacterium]